MKFLRSEIYRAEMRLTESQYADCEPHVVADLISRWDPSVVDIVFQTDPDGHFTSENYPKQN